MKAMTRRALFLAGMGAASFLPRPGASQLKPFRLRVVRIDNLPTTLSLNDCLLGAVYLVDDFQVSDVGQKIADALELPYRSNTNAISAIPAGVYAGHVRTDGNLGWRIEFDAVPGRSNIQIHPGNRTSEIEGCLLVGSSAAKQACTVVSSRDTVEKLKGLYGTSAGRPIEVKLQSG